VLLLENGKSIDKPAYRYVIQDVKSACHTFGLLVGEGWGGGCTDKCLIVYRYDMLSGHMTVKLQAFNPMEARPLVSPK
jgi:hypothetical protein